MAGCADDVAAWLDKLGLTEYTEKFLAAGYSSLQQCVSLSKTDLSAIGIGKVGHVNRLFKDLDRMKANGEIENLSPPRSSSSSPQPPPVVKTVATPVVPPRRTLPRKPNSDGQLTDSPPPPKLLPRKGSLRKCASAHTMQPIQSNMRSIDEPRVTSKIPSSQSLNDICENQSPELKNDLSSGTLHAPPPVAPRPRKPVVPPSNRNGQVSSSNTLPAGISMNSDTGVSPPPVPMRRTTPIAEEEESTGVGIAIKEHVVPPVPAQRTGCSQVKDEVLRTDVSLEEEDELPPPLPVKKGTSGLDQISSSSDVVTSTTLKDAVTPEPAFVEEKMMPPVSNDTNEPPLLPVRASEPPSVPERVIESPSVPIRVTEPPSVPVRAIPVPEKINEPPSVPEKAIEPPSVPVRATEPPSVPERVNEPPSVPARATEPHSVPVRAISVPEKINEPHSAPVRALSVPEKINEPPSVPARATELPSVPERAKEPPSVPARATEPHSVPVRAKEPPSVPARATEPHSVPVRAISVPEKINEPHSTPVRALSVPEKINEPPSVPARATELPSVPERAKEPPSVPARATEPPLVPEKINEPPSVPIRATEPPSVPARATEPASVQRADELPVISPPGVDSSQSLPGMKELSEKSQLTMCNVKTTLSGDDEVFEESKPGDHQSSEDEGSPPPLPVKKSDVIPPPPPPPPEDSEDEECPPLPIKTTTDISSTVDPTSSQVETNAPSLLPLSSEEYSADDEAPPPLPVKKHNKTENIPEVSKEENVVPELILEQSEPKPEIFTRVSSDSVVSVPRVTDIPVVKNEPLESKLEQSELKLQQPQMFTRVSSDSVVSAPNAMGSPVARKEPPVPPRRTVSAVIPLPRPPGSDSEDSDSPAPPLPERKVLVPPPPPTDSDTDSEDDDNFPSKPSLMAVKSVPLHDGNEFDSDIFLSRAKNSMDTSDSSDDDYHSEAKIISQPSLDDDTIMLSSSTVTPDDIKGRDLHIPLAENNNVPTQRISKRLPPPVKRRLGSKVSSPPFLSPPPLSTPPPVRATVPLVPIAKSASSDAIVLLSDDSVYSQIAAEEIKHHDSVTSMYSQVGPAPSQHGTQKVESMYSQIEAVHSRTLRGLNGDMGRPISINLDDVLDGNVPNRMRSMSELPSKLQGKKKKKLSDMSHSQVVTITERPKRRETHRQSSVLSPSASRRGERNYSQVPTTKDGWLQKRGGKHGDKPWTSRWFTFDGHEMKYFKSPSDKAIECLKSIKLIDMIDVKAISDVSNDKKLCRFDLVATNRVFQLASDSQEEVTQWVDVLEAAIKCRSTAGEVEGGSMNNPDKGGFLQKQGHGMIKTWERRYVALKGSRFAYYESKDDFTNGRPINTLEMGLTAVKPDMSGKYRFIITTNRKKEYVFQAVSDTEMREWIEALQKGIMQGLESRTGHNVIPEMNTSSKEILDRLFKNPSNQTCAECSSTDPVWASVNLGIMLCINCSGVHRSMGTHISKVRSTELDQHIWTDSLIDLIVAIGNKRSNEFWEKHCQQKERLASDVERDIRENFIRAKYELKAWIPRQAYSPHEVLNKQLCQTVKTDDVMATLELIVQGANVNFVNTSIKGSNNTPLLIAQEHEQPLQMELLVQHGATVPGEDDDEKDEPVNRQGYLYKTGSERTGWRKRFCSLDKSGFKYYKSDNKSDNNSEVLGEFPVEEMLSVNICEDESAKDPHYKYCFEVATAKRPYLFCAEREFEMQQWVAAFQKIIPVNAEDILGFDKIGYIYQKTPGGWKRKWCTLRKKDMWFYKRHEKEVIDLRKAIELRPPDSQGSFEAQCSFQIVAPSKTHFLKADNVSEADAWYSALRHTQVSGLPLQEQELTNNGIPIIVHKCLQFVESHGIDSEGIYRLSGNKTRVQKLILAFNQDAKGFIIDPETYLVNDVAGALKQFFRSLPDPLLTHHLYAAFINAAQIHDEEEKKTQLQSLVEQLPAVNRETLKRLIGHLKKVVDNVAVNKMSAANMVRIFGPTLMTVDTDESSFLNATYEFSVIELMFRHYLWMFQIDEIEQRKEEEMQKAMKKLEMAQQMQKQHSVIDSKFLVTVYIKCKEGHAFTSKVSQTTTAGELAEEAASSKALTPDYYALYIVLGNYEAERTLHPSERVLTVMQTVQCDFFFCLKQNLFAERVKSYMTDSPEAVTVNLREKKKWRKYPCVVKSNHFVIYRDSKLNHELSRTSVHEFDMFFGTMSDVKNPAPTGHQLYLKTRVEDQSKYVCADSEDDLLKCAGRIAHCKYPDGFPMLMIPSNPLPEEQPLPLTTKPRSLSEDIWTDPDIYVNVKLSKKCSKTLGRDPVPSELMRELSSKLKKT